MSIILPITLFLAGRIHARYEDLRDCRNDRNNPRDPHSASRH
ncbi:MAG: hypothetical protein AB2693_27175 [Candidatus Thiodiazotropha sp.]